MDEREPEPFDLLPPFDRAEDPPTRPEASVEQMIAQAVVRASEDRRASTRRRRTIWQLAASAFLALGVGGTAAAIVYVTLRGESSSAPQPATHRSTRPQTAPPPELPVPEAPAPQSANELTEEDTDFAPTGNARRRVTATNKIRQDLLAAANRLRAQSKWRQAERVYMQVVSEHPASNEGYSALVAAAALRLSQLNDAHGALTLYRRALARDPHGVLAEEARRGIARAYHAVGDRASEERAIDDFIEHHPRSPAASAMRARLAELRGASPTR